MEREEVLKLLVTASEKYMGNKSDASVANLQRKLEVLIEFTKPGEDLSDFNARNFVMVDCVSNMNAILADPDTATFVTQKILALFQNLEKSYTLCKGLRLTFQLIPTLISVLNRYIDKETDLIVLQCLDLLKCLTYGVQFDYSQTYLDGLLLFLVKRIMAAPVTELICKCLSVLSNLCRKNPVVRMHIQNMGNVRSFHRALICVIDGNKEDNCLANITALSICASMMINDKFEYLLFQPKNINYTFELIFNYSIRDDPEVQCAAIDLLMDLTSNKKMQQHLIQYKYFVIGVGSVLDTLKTRNSQMSAAKVYQLILTFCSVDSLNHMIISSLLNKSVTQPNMKQNFINVALHWLTQPLDGRWNAPVKAAKFLSLIIKNANCSQEFDLGRHIDAILENTVKDLRSSWDNCDSEFPVFCEKSVECLIILRELWVQHDRMVADCIHVSACVDLIEIVYDHYDVTESSKYIKNLGASAVDMVINSLLLMAALKETNGDMEDLFYHYLQDSRLMCVWSVAFTLDSSERLQDVIKLINLAYKLPDFPNIRLSECIAECNSVKSKAVSNVQRDEHSEIPASLIPQLTSDGACSTFCSTISSDAINTMADQIETGLKISDLKMKPSGVMEMYEHKIASLESQVKQLQIRVDAKTEDLKLADQLLTKYRSESVQYDAKIMQWRKLLQDSEKRSESAKEEVTKVVAQKDHLEQKLQLATEDVFALDQQLEDQKSAARELQHRLQAEEEKCNGLKQENVSLADFVATLQKRNETYKLKAEEMDEEISKLKVDQKALSKTVKEKEIAIKECKKTIVSLENDQKGQSSALASLEEDNKSLKEQVVGLKKELETITNRMQELESEYEHCRDELDNYVKMQQMIHELSSRKHQKK